MRQMLITGGWDKEALIATPVSHLDRNSLITGTYWLLQGEPRLLCILARDLWPACTDTELSIVLDLGDLSQFEFGDLSTTSTWITSDTVMAKIKFVTGSVRRQITPQQAGHFGAGTFIMRLHLLLKSKDSMRVWVTLLPGSRDAMSERLKPLMGHPTFPGLSYELTHRTKKNIKGAALMPKANNQNMGIFALAIVDSTMVERPPGEDDPRIIDPTS